MNDSFPRRLASLRAEHGLSQEQLSAKIGVSRQAISKWERGESTPDMDNLIALAQMYGLTLDEVVYGSVELTSSGGGGGAESDEMLGLDGVESGEEEATADLEDAALSEEGDASVLEGVEQIEGAEVTGAEGAALGNVPTAGFGDPAVLDDGASAGAVDVLPAGDASCAARDDNPADQEAPADFGLPPQADEGAFTSDFDEPRGEAHDDEPAHKGAGSQAQGEGDGFTLDFDEPYSGTHDSASAPKDSQAESEPFTLDFDGAHDVEHGAGTTPKDGGSQTRGGDEPFTLDFDDLRASEAGRPSASAYDLPPVPEGMDPAATAQRPAAGEPFGREGSDAHAYGDAWSDWEAPAETVADDGPQTSTSRVSNTVRIVSYPVACILAFLLLGACCGLWHPAWMLFLTIPLYETLMETRAERRPLGASFYALLVTFVFLALGFSFGWWHPAWVLFLTIPLYESWKRQGGGLVDRRPIAYAVAALMVLVLITGFGRRVTSHLFAGNWSFGWGSSSDSESAAIVDGNERTEFVDAEAVKDLSIDWASGSVNVVVASDKETEGRIELREESLGGWRNTPYMAVSHKGDVLKVGYGRRGGFLFSCSSGHDKNLTVILPESCAERLGTVEFDGSSGDFEVAGVACRTMEADLSSGSFVVRDSSVDDFNLDLGSGSADFDGTVTSTFDFDVASGTIRLRSDTVPREVDVDVASGDVELLLPEDTGFTAQVDVSSGTFTSDFSTYQQGDRLVAGDGRMVLDADIASGKLSVGRR